MAQEQAWNNVRDFLFSRYFGFTGQFLERSNMQQLAFDALLVIFVLYVIFKKPAAKPEKPLSTKEKDDLIAEWEPEPMFEPIDERTRKLESRIPQITASTSPTHVTINGKSVVNFVRTNFHGFLGSKLIEKVAEDAIRKYGVGTCGPRGFYGTIDCHLELETAMAKYMGMPASMLVSYGYATISSVIPTFAGREDLIIADIGCHHTVKTGIRLSRSEVHYFKHNDVEDLERIFKQIQDEDRKGKRKLTRRWLIIEGLYYNFGDLAPLPKLIELKNKYKFRVMMDDSYGIGLLGNTGRGTAELLRVPVSEFEFITASLESTVGSVGGFACSSKENVFHMRIHAPGYTYSASLPPLLNNAALRSFEEIDKNPQYVSELSKKTKKFYDAISTIPGTKITHQPIGPFIHLRLAESYDDRMEEEEILQNVCDEALANGVFITRAKYSDEHEYFPSPSIRLTICRVLEDSELLSAANVIKQAFAKVLKSGPSRTSSRGTPKKVVAEIPEESEDGEVVHEIKRARGKSPVRTTSTSTASKNSETPIRRSSDRLQRKQDQK